MVLWLDDIRPPEKHGYVGAYWAKTAEEAIAALQTRKYSFASLDHDLSIDATMGLPTPVEETGYSVIVWLEEHPEFWPEKGVRIHSLNPVGRKRMEHAILKRYGRLWDL